MNKLYLIFLFGVLICACAGGSEAPGYGVIDLEDAFDNNSEYVNLSKYASSVEYIPLETNEEANIGNSMRAVIGKDKVYINFWPYITICMFDVSSGEYLRKFNRHGRGPGEYVACSIFAIAEGGNKLIVEGFNKFLIYNSEDSCIHVIHNDADQIGYGNRIFPNDLNGAFFFNESRTEYLSGSYEPVLREYSTLIDSTGVVSRTLLGSRGDGYSHRSKFFSYNGRVKAINSGRDTIYNLTPENDISVEYAITLGKYENFKKLTHVEDRDYFYEPALSEIFETEKFLLMVGVLPENRLPQIFTEKYNKHGKSAILYDKKEKKTYALKKLPDYDHLGFVNDIDNGAPFLPLYTYGNKMYQFIDAEEFISLARQCDVPRIKEVAAQLTEESNPVMVVATLK